MKQYLHPVFWTAPLVLLASACSQQSEPSSAPQATEGEAVAADAAGSARSEAAAGEQPPGIDANVAPGVAFQYAYTYSLAEARISAIQERHATLCGSLGVTHCRVTGLRFNKARDGNVDAMMAFKINPAMALRFAKDATDAVSAAEGRLETSQVLGEDAGAQIVEGDRNAAGIKAELAKIDAQLKIPGLSKDVRSRLVDQAGELRAQLRALEGDRNAKVESLATTPMIFDYEASDAVLGFDRGSPVQQGLSAGSASFGALLTILATFIGVAGPWALLGAAIWWIVRRLRAKKPVVEGSSSSI